MVALRHLRPVAHLPGQLERGLEEVHEQANRPIEPAQRRRCLKAHVAPVARDAPDHSAVLLLHPRLVVLAIRPAAGERDPGRRAVVPHGLVHEHAVVVRIEPQQRKRQPLAHLPQHLGQQRLLAHQQRRALRPAGRDVGQRQRLHEAALRRRPAVRHQVSLHEPRRRVVPVGKRPNRHAAPHAGRRRRPTTRSSSRLPPDFTQRPVDRRRAHRQQPAAHLRRQLKVPVPLHRIDQ